MASAGSTSPLISVILPVRNEAEQIGAILEDLSAQDFPTNNFEVIVVDGLSEDATRSTALKFTDRFSHFQVLDNPAKLSSAARNVGVRAARGNYVIFIDGHCRIPSQSLLSDMVGLFEHKDVQVLCRPQPLTAEPKTWFQDAVSLARSSPLGHAPDSTIYSSQERIVKAGSSGAMYKKDVFEKVGLFDEQFDACEDVEFNTRIDLAGLKALISSKLTVEYFARTSLAKLYRQLYRYGLGRWRLFRKHPSTLGAETLIPVAFVLGVPALPLLWLISFKAAIALSVLYFIYLISVVFVSVTIAWKERKSQLVILPAIFFTIHFGFGLGFLSAMIRSTKGK